MAVTERGRPILTLRELVDVLPEELPRHLATGEDIADVREEIDKLRFNMATKDELKRYATKEELSQFRGEVTAWLIALEPKIDDLTPTIENLTPKVDNIELLLQRVLRRLPLP